jgi:putative lipoic acid-binding regulatory protein
VTPQEDLQMATEPGTEPGLQFPLDWHGKILAQADAPGIPDQVVTVMRSFGIVAASTPGNRSAQGRYLTYTVHATIPDRATLQQVAYALSRIAGVRYVF